MSTAGKARRLAERLRACVEDPMWADHAEVPKVLCAAAADEIERLQKDLGQIADLAHCGGLAHLSESEALVAIRRLTLKHWDKSRSPETMVESVTRAARELGVKR